MKKETPNMALDEESKANLTKPEVDCPGTCDLDTGAVGAGVATSVLSLAIVAIFALLWWRRRDCLKSCFRRILPTGRRNASTELPDIPHRGDGKGREVRLQSVKGRPAQTPISAPTQPNVGAVEKGTRHGNIHDNTKPNKVMTIVHMLEEGITTSDNRAASTILRENSLYTPTDGVTCASEISTFPAQSESRECKKGGAPVRQTVEPISDQENERESDCYEYSYAGNPSPTIFGVVKHSPNTDPDTAQTSESIYYYSDVCQMTTDQAFSGGDRQISCDDSEPYYLELIGNSTDGRTDAEHIYE